jgi:hypothetical protein
MAHLWISGEHGDWAPVLLDAIAFTLDDGRPTRVSDPAIAAAPRDGAAIAVRRVETATGVHWALLAGHDARVLVNGAPVRHGIVVLADRDELRFDGKPALFFSTEILARVEPFPEDGGGGFCPRCKQPIAPGALAVKCPGCGLWHHASDELPCWSYAEQCAACPRHTTPDAGFEWTPEDLEPPCLT